MEQRMKRSEMLKEIKAMIRANSGWLEMWKEGEISYGKMAEELSKRILDHVEDKGMVPPCITRNLKQPEVDTLNEQLLPKNFSTEDVINCSEWED
jgi:hypothetical protein